MKPNDNSVLWQNKIFAWLGLATGFILLIPLTAMQLTNEVNWSLSDFLVMGTLLFGAGSVFLLIARKIARQYWVIVGITIAVIFLWVWAELAVGIFTNWGS